MEALRREAARGGQSFYLHNRVETIEEAAARLRALVPELRIVTAHGQMARARAGGGDARLRARRGRRAGGHEHHRVGLPAPRWMTTVEIQDEHVEPLDLDDAPDLVVIQVYITSAYRAYRLADHYRAPRRATSRSAGCTSRRCRTRRRRTPTRSSSAPAKTRGRASSPTSGAAVRSRVYRSTVRTLAGLPPIRRDLIKRHLYLVPNSIVVSRGCPHVCDFCYKEAFFEGGRSFYTQTVDAALAEIERLPGRHLYFLDDHLFGDRRFAAALFDGMRGMGRLWQAAGTVNAVLAPGSAREGRRGGPAQPVRRIRDAQPGEPGRAAQVPEPAPRLRRGDPPPARPRRDDQRQLRVRHGRRRRLGVRAHRGVGGRAGDRDRDVPHPHAVSGHRALPAHGGAGPHHHCTTGICTTRATPSSARRRLSARAARSTATGAPTATSTAGDRSRAAPRRTTTCSRGLRHFAYAAGWKKFEPLWDLVIRAKRAGMMLPVLETILSEFGRRKPIEVVRGQTPSQKRTEPIDATVGPLSSNSALIQRVQRVAAGLTPP